jgi:hypothetical protein
MEELVVLELLPIHLQRDLPFQGELLVFEGKVPHHHVVEVGVFEA